MNVRSKFLLLVFVAILVLAGGAYGAIWWLLIGGIINVAEAFRGGDLDSGLLAFGLARLVASPIVAIASVLMAREFAKWAIYIAEVKRQSDRFWRR